MQDTKTKDSRFFRFLGSMNLAITLLVILAVASIIGTVLQQNQPYTSYEIKFGSFWFEIFRLLDLYDVYSALWFLAILAFLVISTATCVFRQTPQLLKEIRNFRESAQEKSLRAMNNSFALETTDSPDKLEQVANDIFKAQGYKHRKKQKDGSILLAAKKGSAHHWGYWLTHIGIIVICIGGLMDSRVHMMLAEWQGQLKPETRNIPADQVPEISRVGTGNHTFRGNVDISEGQRANIIFLPLRDGYLVQHLPFEIELKDFRVEHYKTGQPKSFESDLVIHDKELDKPLEATISVNHPLIHKGVAIYQANFGDGGSNVSLKFHPLNRAFAAQTLEANVFKDYKLKRNDQELKLEVTDFRLFNISPVENKEGEIEQKNLGPSVTFKLRNEAGEAVEYVNYMMPVQVKGGIFYVSGMRQTPSEPLRYLHIPVDRNGKIDGFFAFLNNLQDEAFIRKAATESTMQSMRLAQLDSSGVANQVISSMVRLTQTFAQRGFDGITEDIASRFPEGKREDVSEAFMKVLNTSLRAVYLETLKQQGVTGEATVKDWKFFDESLSAIANMPFYGSPWFVQLSNFKHIQASGLQMARSPGQDIVYLGCLMLTIGVFLLFYIAQRRLWILIKPKDNNGSEIIIAGTSNRHATEFKKFMDKLKQAFQPLPARGE